MPKKSVLEITKPFLKSFFDKSEKRVYSRADLERLFVDVRLKHPIPDTYSYSNFQAFLENHIKVKHIV